MKKQITNIQKLFLQKLFMTSLSNCNTIFNVLNSCLLSKQSLDIKSKTYINDLDEIFQIVTSYISNNEIIDLIDKMLNRYYRFICSDNNEYYKLIAPKLDARKFLSSYVIAIFPEFVLSKTENEIIQEESGIFYDIYTLSHNLIRIFHNYYISNTLKTDELIKSINKYSNAFTIFISIDRINKVNELITKWNLIENIKSKIFLSSHYEKSQKKSVIEFLETEQQDIIKYIKLIDVEFNLELLELLKDLTTKIDQMTSSIYWEILEQDITNKEYKILLEALKEIRNELLEFNNNLKPDLDEYFDTDFIYQQIINNVFSYDDFINLSNYIVLKIIDLQAPIRNTDTKNTWNDIKKKSINYTTLIVDTIKFILCEIHNIKSDIILFALQLKIE